tara:strand:+ start:5661 stop:6437 length:777 start_codon:yes stop_codon:yes gene_type:complete
MKKSAYLKLTLFLFLQLNTSIFYSQTNSDLKDYYTWFDSVIGEGNTDLYNGTIYREQYRTEKGNHKFFLSNDYRIGDLVYNNQSYYNVYMKYDIYEDELIVKLPNQSSHLFIKLVKEKINEFSIKDSGVNLTLNNHQFITNSSFKENNKKTSLSFYEVVTKTSSITLLKKNRKKRSDYIANSTSYSKFSENSHFAILYENNYHKISSKKNLTRLFPNFKKDISAFYRTERNLYKSNKEAFFSNLIENITTFITKTDTQ